MHSYCRNLLFGFLVVGHVLASAGCGQSRRGGEEEDAASIDAGAGVHANQPENDLGTGEATVESATETAAALPMIHYSDEAFRIAAHDGNIDIVHQALRAGTEVDASDPIQGYTALLMAAYNGHTQIVKLLLEKGAEVDRRDSEGKTPLIHASSGPFAETVEVLLNAGADIDAAESTEGFTALMTAAALGQPEVVALLLKHGADPSILDADKDSAKDHAANAGHKAIVNLLP